MGGIRKSRGSLWLGIIGLAILLLGSVAPLWSLSHLSWRLVDQPAPAFWMSILLAIVGVALGLRLHAVIALLGLSSIVVWAHWFEAAERHLMEYDLAISRQMGPSDFGGILALGDSRSADFGWLILLLGSVVLVASGAWGRFRDGRW
jgi:hypothetical protein